MRIGNREIKFERVRQVRTSEARLWKSGTHAAWGYEPLLSLGKISQQSSSLQNADSWLLRRLCTERGLQLIQRGRSGMDSLSFVAGVEPRATGALGGVSIPRFSFGRRRGRASIPRFSTSIASLASVVTNHSLRRSSCRGPLRQKRSRPQARRIGCAQSVFEVS